MTHKLLPLPVGGGAPKGSRVRRWDQYSFRARMDGATRALGLVLAGAGALVGLNPAPVVVLVDHSGYHLGAITLVAAGPDRFNGDSAIVIRRSASIVQASGAGQLGGQHMQGLCTYSLGSRREDCAFVVGSVRFQAVDQAGPGGWRRRYDDGRTVEIRLADPAHPTPVPVPVGWR